MPRSLATLSFGHQSVTIETGYAIHGRVRNWQIVDCTDGNIILRLFPQLPFLTHFLIQYSHVSTVLIQNKVLQANVG